jgi:hypothetical protein
MAVISAAGSPLDTRGAVTSVFVFGRRLALAVAATIAVVGVGAPSATGAYRKYTTRIGPGVKFTRIKDPKGPWRVKIVTVNLAKASTMDVALSNDKLPRFERTSSMARRHGALAAINGDYARPNGRPVFAFAEDGDLKQTPLKWGRNFSVDASEINGFIGHPDVSVWAYEHDAATQYTVSKVNVECSDFCPDEMSLFTPAGGTDGQPSELACSARLYPSESPDFTSDGFGVEADHLVEKVACGQRVGRRGGVVLSAPLNTISAQSIYALVPGESVTLGWSLGWPRVRDTIGGNPTLIENGVIVGKNVTGSERFFNRHPRTGVGLRSDGRVLMVTVDGRSERSVGMTLREFADLFASLDASWALNLDGGGSTTMVVNGDVKNRPSDGTERPVSSALLVLRGSDSGEIAPEAPAPSPVPGPQPSIVWRKVARDPASTGGLASYLRARGYDLPSFMIRAVRLLNRTRG